VAESPDRGAPERALRESYNAARRSLRAIPMTETELRLMAALAMIGERRRPKKG
jgi:hypothetical protein